MIKITLNDGSVLSLPEEWGELDKKQILLAIRLFCLVSDGKITPFDFQVQMLLAITGYKPAHNGLWHKIKLHFWGIVNVDKYKRLLLDDEYKAEMVKYNLIRLSESLTFAFEVKDNVITPNYYYSENPFVGVMPNAPHFTRRYTIETDLTARQFAEGVDLMSALRTAEEDALKHHILRRLASTLYKLDYSDTEDIPFEMLIGNSMWFTGVVKYFQEHPVYQYLFGRATEEESGVRDRLDLGMNEIILSLQKSGYPDAADMNLIDFMDAQIKSIKDNISKALADGVKPDELAKRTKMPYNIINSLK